MTVSKKDFPGIKFFLFASKISEKRKISNVLLKSLNLIIAKGVPFDVFFSFINKIVPAINASFKLLFSKSLKVFTLCCSNASL